MGRNGISWRTWTVLCLQVVIVAAKSLQELDESTRSSDSLEDVNSDIEARGKKKKKMKYLLIFFLGVLVVKGILIPIALKAVSLLAGKAFLLSAFSLILSAIIGFRQMAHSSWERMGEMMMKDKGEITELYHPIPTEEMYHQKSSTGHYWTRDIKNN